MGGNVSRILCHAPKAWGVAVVFVLALVGSCAHSPVPIEVPLGLKPGGRSILDAHNCYPHNGRWGDRMERALGSGLPLAIEQDLCWVADPQTGRNRSIVSHGSPFRGDEPTLEAHFFDRVAPIMKAALDRRHSADWPLVVLNLEFKNGEEEHVRSVWELLKSHESWLSTVTKTSDLSARSAIRPGPMLVLLGGGGAQDRVFYEEVPVGGNLLAFAAAPTRGPDTSTLALAERWMAVAAFPPEQILAQPSDNYHRWWNNSWYVVEEGGAMRAGDWTEVEHARLRSLTEHAHRLGYWIRFYTVNGHAFADHQAWSPDYNTGTLERARTRWRAAVDVGVDFIASDMYEEAARIIQGGRTGL